MTLPERRFPRFALLAALVCASAASTARADAPPAPATATAEQLAEQAYQEHASGRYGDAIATYLRAFELSHAGAILFNVATIYDRKLGERGLAEDYYRRYLAVPDAEPDLVRKATERLTVLKKQDDVEADAKRAPIVVAPVTAAPLPAAASSVATVAPPRTQPAAATGSAESPVAPSSYGRGPRAAGIVVGAVGVASVGVSLVLGAIAKGKNDDANAVCNGSACSSDRGVTLASQAGSYATASTVTFVAGLALVGGGVAMFVLAPKASSPVAQWRVAPTVSVSGAGFSLAGSF